MTDFLPPESLLRVLREQLGDYMLIGSFARDYICRAEAGLGEARATEDVDVTVVVADARAFRSTTAALDSAKGLATRFAVGSIPVDVLPAIEHAGTYEIQPGVHTDLTGQHEAFTSARVVDVAEEFSIRVPTLQAMIVLKIVAWNMRGSTTAKDAQDLLQLLNAAPRWQVVEDELYDHEAFERFGDVEDTACFLLGIRAVEDLPEAVARLSETQQAWRERLAIAMSGGHGARASVRHQRARALLGAFIQGWDSTQAEQGLKGSST